MVDTTKLKSLHREYSEATKQLDMSRIAQVDKASRKGFELILQKTSRLMHDINKEESRILEEIKNSALF